jgi:hypothetical protein
LIFVISKLEHFNLIRIAAPVDSGKNPVAERDVVRNLRIVGAHLWVVD